MASVMIWIPGQIPSGKNAVIVTRTGKRFPQKRFKEWREHALRYVGMALQDASPWRDVALQRPLFTSPVHLAVFYQKGDRRRRDAPGMLDALLHVLEKGEIVRDDCLVESVKWIPYGDKSGPGGPGVLLRIYDHPLVHGVDYNDLMCMKWYEEKVCEKEIQSAKSHGSSAGSASDTSRATKPASSKTRARTTSSLSAPTVPSRARR